MNFTVLKNGEIVDIDGHKNVLKLDKGAAEIKNADFNKKFVGFSMKFQILELG